MEVLGFLFVVAKVVVVYLKLVLIVFVNKLANVQTCTLVFQCLLCKHVLLT
jgi:hypothetical protein